MTSKLDRRYCALVEVCSVLLMYVEGSTLVHVYLN